MGEIILQLSTTVNSWSNRWSWVIRHLSHSPFSHVDMEIPGHGLLGASDSPNAKVLSGNPRGVALRPYDYEAYGYRRRMVIETLAADHIRDVALTQIGKPFDNDALKAFMSAELPMARDWRETDKWFCSELVAWAFEASGYWGPRMPIWPKDRISPSDLLMLFLFDRRWANRETFWEEK